MTNSKDKKSAKSATPASATKGLIVLGFDAQQKPCGARFIDAKPALVVKAAQHMGLRVYKVISRDVSPGPPRSCPSASSMPTAAPS